METKRNIIAATDVLVPIYKLLQRLIRVLEDKLEISIRIVNFLSNIL